MMNLEQTVPHVCIKGGDNKYTAIAAASILAKGRPETNILRNLCKQNPKSRRILWIWE